MSDINSVIIEELSAQRRELGQLRQMMAEALNAIRQAETEIPERMRRFVNYMHDMHHIVWTYEEKGVPAPGHVLREMERCDDRLRQLLAAEHRDGTFAKIRVEMADDPHNRWDHTRLLTKPEGAVE